MGIWPEDDDALLKTQPQAGETPQQAELRLLKHAAQNRSTDWLKGSDIIIGERLINEGLCLGEVLAGGTNPADWHVRIIELTGKGARRVRDLRIQSWPSGAIMAAFLVAAGAFVALMTHLLNRGAH